MFKFILFIQPLVGLAAELRPGMIFSDLTPSSFESELTSVVSSSGIPIEIYRISSISDPLLSFLEGDLLDLIFDFTYSLSYQNSLLSLAVSLKIPYFHPGRPPKNSKVSNWAFYLHQDSSHEADALLTLLEFLQVQEYFLISTSDYSSTQLASFVGKYHTIPSVSPQSVFNAYISGTVKTSGNWRIVCISEAAGCLSMFESTIEANMYDNLLAFVTNGKGSLTNFKNGVISVIEEGLEEAENEGEYEGFAVLRAIDTLQKLDRGRLKEELEEITLNHGIVSNYSVINFKTDNKRETVGKISSWGIEEISEIVFPKNSSSTESTLKPKIRISANLGYLRSNGRVDTVHYLAVKGLFPMIPIINSDESLLKNFELELFETHCNSYLQEYKAVKNCMKQYVGELKNFYIENRDEDLIKDHIQMMKELGVGIVHGSALIDYIDLYDTEKYPNLVITTAHYQYFFTILPYIISSFGWKNIIFFRDTSKKSQEIFIQNCELLGIKIWNSNQVIDRLLDLDNHEAYQDYVQEIIDSKCRIIVSLMGIPSNVYMANILYDYGFRKGDLVMITMSKIQYVVDELAAYHDRDKAIEIMDGSISVYYLEYVGDYGEHLEEQLAPSFHPGSSDFTCFHIDTLLLGVHTLNMLIDLEFDYENTDLINKYIRKQYFQGCSGTIAIENGGNGPRDKVFGIHNFYVKEDGNTTEKYIGTYHLGTIVPLKLDREIYWPNGSTEIPSDLIRDIPCQNSGDKSIEQYFIIDAMLALACILSGFLAFSWRGESLDMMESKRNIKFEDAFLLALPLAESLQYDGLGRDFNPLLTFAGSLAIFDLSVRGDQEYETFWRFFILVLGAVVIWIISLLFCVTKLYRRSPEAVKDCVYYIGYIYFTFVAQYGFIPCILTMMKIFDCKDTFNYDCNVVCWQGFHLILAVCVVIVVVVYISLSLIFKREVDSNMEAINIKTVPSFYFLKCLLHLVLILLYVNEVQNIETYYAGLFVLWTVLIYKMKLSNYKRFDFWQRLIILGTTLNRFLVMIYKFINEYEIVFIVVQVIIFLVIGVFGLIVQWKHYPSMLYRKPASNIHKLIKFAFGRGVTEKDLTIKEFDYVEKNVGAIQPRAEIVT